MKYNRIGSILITISLILFTSLSGSASPESNNYRLISWTLSSAGQIQQTTNFKSTTALSQPVTGLFTNANYSLKTGFIYTIAGLDSTPPTGSIKINNDATYTNSTSVTLILSAQDNTGGSGLSQMRFSNDGSSWSDPEAYTTTKSWTLTSGEGQKTVYVKFSDVAGNWPSAVSAKIILDTIPPATTVSGIDNIWHRDPVTVTLFSSDSGSGLETTYYSIDNSSPGNIYSGPFAITEDGRYSLGFYAVDRAGNTEVIKNAINQIKIDRTPPSGSILINNGEAITHKRTAILNLSASDAVSGMGPAAQMAFSNDGSDWSIPENYAVTKDWQFSDGSGEKTVYVKYKDAAGNWSAPVNDTITLDTSASVNVTEVEVVLGTVTLNSTTISPVAFTVTNKTPESKVTYLLSLSSPAGWQSSQTATGQDTYVLNAAFSDDLSKITWDNAEHALSAAPVACSSTKFAGDQTGLNVPYNEQRKLWFQFKAPTVTEISTEQIIKVIITAQVAN